MATFVSDVATVETASLSLGSIFGWSAQTIYGWLTNGPTQ